MARAAPSERKAGGKKKAARRREKGVWGAEPEEGQGWSLGGQRQADWPAMSDKVVPEELLARHRQVFCVTHQPLVAAGADHHFRVSKDVRDGITRSRVSHLRDTQQRQLELAELAGGDQARAYAASLLDQKSA